MAKKNDDFTCDIIERIGYIKPPTDAAKSWCKSVMRIKWGDNPATLDIRNTVESDGDMRVGKGISLSNEEADRLVSILLDSGYGSLEDLEAAVKRRVDIFKVPKPDPEDETLYINIP